MTNVQDLITREYRESAEIIDEMKKEFDKRMSSGDNGGMDAWQTSVETRLGKIETTLTDIKVEIAKLVGKIDGLPTKAFVIGTIISLFSLCLACVAFGANFIK